MTTDPMRIEPMTLGHTQRMAEIHAQALAGDFLPSLGVGFLAELYRGILGLGLGFGFVAGDGKDIGGFVIASEDTSRLFRSVLMRRSIPLGLRLVPALARRPMLLRNIIETFTYPEHEGALPIPAELVVIAVDATRRGQGAGAALCAALDAEFRRRSIRRYKVTVNQSNDGANRFYVRQGFELAYSFRLYGRGWNLYTRDLA
jgi:ribosomal protein S18 acetylase RimI-like enzyme